jgi:hypothetical protein
VVPSGRKILTNTWAPKAQASGSRTVGVKSML